MLGFLPTPHTTLRPHLHIPGGELSVLVEPRGSQIHAAAEASLLEAGIPIPIPHRTAWSAVRRDIASVAYVLRHDPADRYVGVFCADLWPSRMVPGWAIMRIERFGNLDDAYLGAAVSALVSSLRRLPRILRLRIEVHTLNVDQLARTESALEAHGFERQSIPRNYEETGLVDLTPALEDIFAGLHGTCRRHVRAVEKKGGTVAPVLDERLASRLQALQAESHARTGAVPHPWDWQTLIRFSAVHPTLSRISGLFRTDVPEGAPEALIAFAWGVHHGDHVQFVAGGATRDSGLKIPLAYASHWDLMRWARENGARHYDMGGITRGTASDSDPVGGISDFKRYFRPTIRTVGSEYSIDGSRILGGLSRLVGRAAGLRAGY